MPYLNLDLNYCEHPKTRRLIALLGPEADIYPIRLWSYCGKIHAKDGAMKGYSRVEVEAVLGWKGRKGALVAALLKVGFISAKDGFSCVDWHQHQGHLEAFSRRGKAAADARWNRLSNKDATSIAKPESSNAPTVPTVPALPSLPSKPTVPTDNGERTVDLSGKFNNDLKAIADKKARWKREADLLSMTWKVRGEHFGRSVQNIPWEYCQWALGGGLTDIGTEYREALKVRLEQKRAESIQ